MNSIEISWLKEFAKSWLDRIEQNRLPHAVLLAGPIGTGKRAAATWMAARHLEISPTTVLPQFPVTSLAHADLRWITPAEDKQAIGIDQIRELVADMSLTSYAGGGKVAVIEPANAMTTNAANSLLKTLEEPSGDALLILIADRTGRLPATIFSRCQRIEFAPPGEAASLVWLDRLRPGASWAEALALAGNAPLAALTTIDQLDTHTSMSRDFADVAAGRSAAIEVAARWSRLDAVFVLGWMAQQVRQLICVASGVALEPFAHGIDESVLRRMDRRNLFCYLDIINRLRGQPGGSYNVLLTLEGLLIDLAEGLAFCGRNPLGDAMTHVLLKR